MNEKTIASKKGTIAIFQTRDILLASYLRTKGYEIDSVVSANGGGKVIFGFIDRPVNKERETDVLDFYNDRGGYLKFADAWRNLKSLLPHYKEKI